MHYEMIELQRANKFVGFVTAQESFLKRCGKNFDQIVPENPNYKTVVEESIFYDVFSLVGAKAFSIVNLLIEEPIDEIRKFMQDWKVFNARVTRLNSEIEAINDQLMLAFKQMSMIDLIEYT